MLIVQSYTQFLSRIVLPAVQVQILEHSKLPQEKINCKLLVDLKKGIIKIFAL